MTALGGGLQGQQPRHSPGGPPQPLQQGFATGAALCRGSGPAFPQQQLAQHGREHHSTTSHTPGTAPQPHAPWVGQGKGLMLPRGFLLHKGRDTSFILILHPPPRAGCIHSHRGFFRWKLLFLPANLSAAVGAWAIFAQLFLLTDFASSS